MSQPSIDDVFEGFNTADPSSSGSRGPRIDVLGEHVVQIKKVRYQPSKNPKTNKSVYFIVEFIVIETDVQTVHVGKTYAWSHDLTNQFYGLENTKQFIAAAAGLDPMSPDAKEKITNADAQESFAEDKVMQAQDGKWYVQEKSGEFRNFGTKEEPSYPGFGTKEEAEENMIHQPLTGRYVRLKTQPKTTENGQSYTVHDWSPYVELDG